MNKIKLTAALFLWAATAGSLGAQHSLQSRYNMFRADDVIIKQQVEYKDPGRSGANVLWDFSRLNVVNDEYELAYSTHNDTRSDNWKLTNNFS